MFWRRQQVEDLALITLLDFRRRTGRPLGPPVDVELVGEIACGLIWDWEPMPEPPQTRVWAALYPSERRVALNETHRDTFTAKPGFERFTRAHEIGHWILHVEGGRWHLEDDNRPGGTDRTEPLNTTDLGAFNDSSAHPPPGYGALPPNIPISSTQSPARPWVERHADWFAASLLMPAALFVPAAEDVLRRCKTPDFADWRPQDRLARTFGVTRSALRVRLSDLGLFTEAQL